MAITPFVGTDNFNMTSFNNMINQANSSFSSNKNLLDNWDFTNPVNQRGLTTYVAGDGHISGIDRWRVYYGTANIVEGGIQFSAYHSTLQYAQIGQILDYNISQFEGKTVTVSAIVDGETISVSGTVNEATATAQYIAQNFSINGYTVYLYFSYTTSKMEVFMRMTGANIIEKIKFEMGDVSTIENDTFPNYADELLKCQRYFQTFYTQSLRPSNALDFRPVMRANPNLSSISVSGTTLYVASAEI